MENKNISFSSVISILIKDNWVAWYNYIDKVIRKWENNFKFKPIPTTERDVASILKSFITIAKRRKRSEGNSWENINKTRKRKSNNSKIGKPQPKVSCQLKEPAKTFNLYGMCYASNPPILNHMKIFRFSKRIHNLRIFSILSTISPDYPMQTKSRLFFCRNSHLSIILTEPKFQKYVWQE